MKITTVSFLFSEGDHDLLNDKQAVHDLLHDIVKVANLTPLDYSVHAFEPQGLSAALILSESHIALHTWPEDGTGYVLLSSCMQPDENFIPAASDLIQKAFRASVNTAKELQ